MIKLKPRERRSWESPDLATPTERKWLNKLEKERPDMAPMKITSREGPETGQFRTVTKLLRSRLHGSAFGCFCMDLNWIKQEVRRCRRQRLKREHQETENFIGSFI